MLTPLLVVFLQITYNFYINILNGYEKRRM